MDDTTNSPITLFFSQAAHDRRGGRGTKTYRNAAGEVVKANYTGYAIDGFPGFQRNNRVIRPDDFETFRIIGLCGPDHFVFQSTAPERDPESRPSRDHLKFDIA